MGFSFALVKEETESVAENNRFQAIGSKGENVR